MDNITVSAVQLDDYLITAEVIDDAISISVELEHEIVLNLFEYPAEITVLSAKISEVEEVSNEANSAATTALAAATTAQSSADAAMSQAEAATDMAATNTLSISSILSNFTAWVLATYLGALTLLDIAIAAGDSLQEMAGKLQGQMNAVKVRLGLLENNIIADFVTTSTLTTIDVTGLNFVDGDVFTVECIGTSTVENGICPLALNNKKVTEYWYNGSAVYQGFLGLTGGFYRNVWTVRVNTFNCFCSSDHHRSNAAGNAFVMFAVNSQTKPTTIGGLVATPITMISITSNPNGLAAGTRIIVKKKIS